MVVVVDSDNIPFIHASGTTAEVLAHLKGVGVPLTEIAKIWYNGTNTSCVYRR